MQISRVALCIKRDSTTTESITMTNGLLLTTEHGLNPNWSGWEIYTHAIMEFLQTSHPVLYVHGLGFCNAPWNKRPSEGLVRRAEEVSEAAKFTSSSSRANYRSAINEDLLMLVLWVME